MQRTWTNDAPPWLVQTLVDTPMLAEPSAKVTRVVTVIIPAHNEELTLAGTIACLQRQSTKPDRIIVACDNCTDGTEVIAISCDADIYVTNYNQRMKAGALNQVLEWLIPVSADHDVIMIIDADSHVTKNFITEIIQRFSANHQLGGLSGIYDGKDGGGFVGWCQRNEFARWGFDARQQNGKAICLSGAASGFTVGALRRVKAARLSGKIGGGSSFYATDNFTEDFEFTQALLHCGYQIQNMMNVAITTAIKPTWTELHVQRLRWNRGITETLLAFGITKHTRFMWTKWCIYIASVFSIPLSFFLISYRFASGEGWQLNAWMMLWLAVTGVISLYKSVTVVKSRGIKTAVIAAALLPEVVYDSFLHLTFLRSLVHVIAGTRKSWR